MLQKLVGKLLDRTVYTKVLNPRRETNYPWTPGVGTEMDLLVRTLECVVYFAQV